MDEEEVAAEAAAVAAAAEADDDAGEDTADSLTAQMEGSTRLKRLLTRDEDDEPEVKKAKMATPEGQVIEKILAKWTLADDGITRHVLWQQSLAELEGLFKAAWQPDKYHHLKCPGELLARACSEQRERQLSGGGQLDEISTFRFRSKLSPAEDKKLRTLSHKDLRYVIEKYDGTQKLDEVIEEAAKTEQAEDNTTGDCLPNDQGIGTLNRFHRLELIDPLADAAIFGDANLTFAIKLAKHRTALGHVGRVIATTFEDLPTLRERYKEIDESIDFLEGHYAEVYHGVDCTQLAVNPKFEGLEGSLGACYYNFPHSGAIQGFFDGHPVVNWRHENLMRLFFRALRNFCKPGCIAKVASNMGAVGVRYGYIVGGAIENEFAHVETVPFTEWCLHRYGRSYGDRRDTYKRPDAVNNQSYNAQRADSDMVYCFKYTPTGKDLPPQQVRLPPTLKTIASCTDGPFKHLQGYGKEKLAKSLHQRFVTEISGVHVG